MRASNWVIGLFLLAMLALAGCSSDDLVACDVFAKADCLTLYDDFSGGVIDGGKWTQSLDFDGEETLAVVSGEVRAYALSSVVNPYERARLSIVAGSGVAAIGADVRVEALDMQATGSLGRARIIGFFYNVGSSTPSDSTGDVGVELNMTDTDVNYRHFQCNDSGCTAPINISTPVSIGTVSLNTTHTLYLGYNGGTSVTAQLDTGTAVTFDTSAAGAFGGVPGLYFREVGVRITPSTAGGETVTAYFDNVRTGATAP